MSGLGLVFLSNPCIYNYLFKREMIFIVHTTRCILVLASAVCPMQV